MSDTLKKRESQYHHLTKEDRIITESLINQKDAHILFKVSIKKLESAPSIVLEPISFK